MKQWLRFVNLTTASLLMFGVIVLMLSSVAHVLAQSQTSTGFYYPAGTRDRGGYIGWYAYNSAFGGWHVAWDFKKNYGDRVVAVADGEVIYSRTDVSSYGGDTRPGGGVVVKHYAREGNNNIVFYALYGHMEHLAGLGPIKAGQQVGTVGHYYSGNGDIPHTHFGIHPSQQDSNPWRGYTKNQSDPMGWVDPVPWLEAHSPVSSGDTTPPIGAIDSPLPEMTVNGNFTIAGWAADPESQIAQVHLLLDGSDIGQVSYGGYRSDVGGNFGFQMNWNTGSAKIGPHTLTLRMVNNANLTQDVNRAITVTRDYLLLREQGGSTVHVIFDTVRRAFNSAECFADWRQDFSRVQDVPRSTIEKYGWNNPIAHLITPNGIDWFYVQDGFKRHITTIEVFKGMGFSEGDIVQVTDDRFNAYKQWNDLSEVEPRLIVVDGPKLPAAAQRYAGNSLPVEFTVRNIAAQSVTAQNLIFSVRGPNGENYDFAGSGNVTLGSGAEYTYRAERALPGAGRYTFNPAFVIHGDEWHSVLGSGRNADIPTYFDVAAQDPVVALTLAPASVSSGAASQATVTLGGPAPTGGVVVSLASDNANIASVPAQITVPAGSTTATFTVTAKTVGASGQAIISAADSGGSAMAALTVTSPSAPRFSSVAVASPSTFTPGSSGAIQATVTNAGGAQGNVIVDIEVIDAGGKNVGQQVFTGQNFLSGQSQTYAYNWTSPAALGQYSVKVGVFGGPNWSPLYNWNDAACALTVVAPSMAQYNFESGLQGWTSSDTSLLNVSRSTARSYDGVASLAVTFQNGSAGAQRVYVPLPSTSAGKTITFHIWFPADAPITALQPFVLQGAPGNWQWTGNFQTAGSLVPGGWNTLMLTVPANAVAPLAQLGVEFFTGASWSGTCYVDAISW